MYDWITQTKPSFKQSEFLKLYINFERKKLIERIEKRTMKMIKLGAIKEVKKLRNYEYFGLFSRIQGFLTKIQK